MTYLLFVYISFSNKICKLYNTYLMIISEIQSEIGHCSCDSAKYEAPANFSHHAILFFTLSLTDNVDNVSAPCFI